MQTHTVEALSPSDDCSRFSTWDWARSSCWVSSATSFISCKKRGVKIQNLASSTPTNFSMKMHLTMLAHAWDMNWWLNFKMPKITNICFKLHEKICWKTRKDWLESGAITGLLPCKVQWSSKLLSALAKLSTNVHKNKEYKMMSCNRNHKSEPEFLRFKSTLHSEFMMHK